MKMQILATILIASSSLHAETYLKHELSCEVRASVEDLSNTEKDLPKKLQFKLNVTEVLDPSNSRNMRDPKLLRPQISEFKTVEALSKKECKRLEKAQMGLCVETRKGNKSLFVFEQFLKSSPLELLKVDVRKLEIESQREIINTFLGDLKPMSASEAADLLKILGNKDTRPLSSGLGPNEASRLNEFEFGYRIKDKTNFNNGRIFTLKLDCDSNHADSAYEHFQTMQTRAELSFYKKPRSSVTKTQFTQCSKDGEVLRLSKSTLNTYSLMGSLDGIQISMPNVHFMAREKTDSFFVSDIDSDLAVSLNIDIESGDGVFEGRKSQSSVEIKLKCE